MGVPAAPAIAAALRNPVTPPMRMRSGMMRAQAFFRSAGVTGGGAVEIFAYLDRRLQFGGEPGAAVEIVVEDRFLDPDQAMIVDHVAAPQGVGEIKGVVEIDNNFGMVAHI